MTTSEKNREVACKVGNLVTAFYVEVDILPLSEPAKKVLVMILVSNLTTRNGKTVTFNLPARQLQREATRPPQTPPRPLAAAMG